ncbi:MAG: helix-turn-helix domain-containing protein [Actinobacteria bacterium]|nr:helix-turn-helix domain-containing protein [Actinomycetota bacterium]
MTSRLEQRTESAFLEAYADVSAAVEAGAGLPEVARAAERALGASLAVVDVAGSVLAVACRSPDDERTVLSGDAGRETRELRVADTPVGELRYRPRGEPPPSALVAMVGTLIALEVERSRAPERASEAAVADFVADLLERRVTDRDNIVARGRELGTDLAPGAGVVVVRARPTLPEEGDWWARVLAVVERAARAVQRSSLTAVVEFSAARPAGAGGARDPAGELVVVVAAGDAGTPRQVAESIRRELEAGLPSFEPVVAVSRPASDPVDIHRAGAEAVLAANVAEADRTRFLAFEDSGSYRLLLRAMTDDPAELQRFHEETIAPLVAYDEQYETELVRTLESFLDEDASVARTSEKLYTHRHTIRYRLERVRELTGLDVSSTDGRERLGLGLKAMRVLGIMPPRGPASEPGTEAGRVPLEEPDR